MQSGVASPPSILRIRNSKTRDLLRGLLSRHPDSNIRATLQRVASSVTSIDLAIVDRLLRESPLFKHVPLVSEFPTRADLFLEDEALVFSPLAQTRVEYIIHRANQNAARLVEALKSLVRINEAVFRLDDSDIIAELELAIDGYGHSLALARKLAFVLGHREKDTETWRLAAKAFAGYGLNARNYGMMAVADSIGFEFAYIDLKSSFERFADYKRGSSKSQKISYLSFNPVSFSHEEVSENVISNYQISLIDSLIYVLIHLDLGVISTTASLDSSIEEAWLSFQDLDFDFELYFGNSSSGDSRAFRAAPAFMEHRRFRDLRVVAQRLYNTPTSRLALKNQSNEQERSFFAAARSVRDLLPSGSEAFDPLPSSFDAATAGGLVRSCALVHVLERDPSFSGVTREEMGALMGTTFEVDRLISTSTLRAAVETAEDDFVRLILRTLLRAHSPLTRDSFEFKTVFQRYVNANHAGDILAFLKAVRALNADVVAYFINILDETLLSQMPFLVPTADSVYEIRAQLLEMLAEFDGDEFARDRAKQLRIDRKIASVRGQINETRLNIDGLRFRQWIDSSKLSEFSGLIRQAAITLPENVDVQAKKTLAELRLSAHRDPVARAALAIMDCYREFCTNSDFGVASYLGRRIRHGTLRGTLLNDLPDPDTYDLPPSAKAHFRHWKETFKNSIYTILAKLHFANKAGASRAIISAEIDSKEKWERLLVCLRTVHEKAQADHGAALIPLTVEQFCWFIFEIELRDIQRAILESRAEFGTFKVRQAVESDAIRFERDVNIALSDRFNQVASWFKKPPNISPIANISDIIEVALGETKAEFPAYRPSTASALEGVDLELSGGVYYHVYDALSIVIRNAGQHGANPGTLHIAAASETRDMGELLHLSVRSSLKNSDTGASAMQRMMAAARLGASGADVIEGLSGMRKLEKMKIDGTIYNYSIELAEGSQRELVVNLSFRRTGIVE